MAKIFDCDFFFVVVFVGRFPPQHYCTLYGFAMVCCGFVSFLQYPLLVLEQRSFAGNMFNVSEATLLIHCVLFQILRDRSLRQYENKILVNL